MIIGVATTTFYVYLNYLMVDEEVDEMFSNACLRLWRCCSSDSSSKEGDREAGFLDQSARSSTGLIH